MMFKSGLTIRATVGRGEPSLKASHRLQRLILAAALFAGIFGWLSGTQASPAKSTANQPATPGHQTRWIGVAVEGIPPVFGHLLGLKAGQGMLVVMVVRGSPAAKAGLVPGDLIASVNHKRLFSPMQLVAAENQRVNGKIQACHLRVVSDGKTVKMRICSVPRPDLAHIQLSVMRLADPMIIGPALEAPSGHAALRAMSAKMAPLELPSKPMTLTRRVDVYGFVHFTITFNGKTYPIQPSTLNSLPPPVKRVVDQLTARHVIVPANPPTTAEKLAVLKARLKFLHEAERQVQAELKQLLRE